MREPLAMEQLETVSTTGDPLAEAIRRADLAALWRAIEALPRQQRDALLLREFGGLSYGELSAALAVSGAAVESLLFRARHRLRGRLRTIYASVSGASWIDALVRLVAGGGAPVAAKVAALGVGAAVVGSTAVVVPNVLDNHRPRSTQRTPAALVHRSNPHPAPPLVERVVPAPMRAPARTPVTPVPIVRVSSKHGAGQDAPEASRQSQGSEHVSDHAARAEASIEHADRSGSGDGGALSGSDQHGQSQKGDGGDGSSSSGEGSDGGSSSTIPSLPAPPPPSGDDGGN
jgi:uncharacterized membrane protein YgcG